MRPLYYYGLCPAGQAAFHSPRRECDLQRSMYMLFSRYQVRKAGYASLSVNMHQERHFWQPDQNLAYSLSQWSARVSFRQAAHGRRSRSQPVDSGDRSKQRFAAIGCVLSDFTSPAVIHHNYGARLRPHACESEAKPINMR